MGLQQEYSEDFKTKRCIVDGCDRPKKGLGRCKIHWRKYRVEVLGIVCSVAGCGREVALRGMCQPHDRRNRRYGHPVVDVPIGVSAGSHLIYGTPKQRFFQNIDYNQITGVDGECWIWAGACEGVYPTISDQSKRLGRRHVGAHCWAYEEYVGSVPDGWHVDHLCGQRHCVNPDHLEAVPPLVNLMRGTVDAIFVQFGEDKAIAELEFLIKKRRGVRDRSGVWA